VRRQWRLVALVTLASFLAALAWTVVRTPSYEATSTLLASPLPATNEAFIGIDVLRESADPTRTIQTAAAVLDTREAAVRTAAVTGRGTTAADVRKKVAIKPEGQTNVIDVTAKADSAEGAARLANAYVTSALALRKERIRQQVTVAVADLERQLKVVPADSTVGIDLRARLQQLTAVRDGTDPTLSVDQPASPPDASSVVPASVLLIISLLIGLVVGTGVAVWADSTRRRGATHGELVATYPLPLLAHVPRPVRGGVLRQADSSPEAPTPEAAEAYRSVLTQLHRRERSTLLVTSASADDGKTHVAVGIAMVAAASGLRVALVDFDLRKPAIGEILGIPENQRAQAAHLGRAGSKLVPIDSAPGLSVLAFRDEPLTSLGLEMGLRGAPALLEELGDLFDVVVVDTPPLGEVSDALRMVPRADDVLIVARPDHTSLAAFARMRDLLERSGHPASGMVVVGGRLSVASGYPYGSGIPIGTAGISSSSR
jgi:Mrp family chromosome partitioning ATPase